MSYKSRFHPKNHKKYIGDINNIICRSTWERFLAGWADRNLAVIKWGMENVVIRYFDRGRGKYRRYFVDFYMEFKDGQKFLIEIKPRNQTKPPKQPQRITAKYSRAVQTYATNISKWEEATTFADERGMKFSVWTEDHLKKLGMNVI
jgi:hypothetical protein